MLYLFYGSDTDKARAKAGALVATLQAKKPDAVVVRQNVESFDAQSLPELVGGQGLFVIRQIVVLDTLLSDERKGELLLSELSALAKSPNIFVVVEGKLDAKTLKKFEKCAEKSQEFSKKETARERFNTFALADVLGARDVRKLWVLYCEAKMRDVSDEEIHGTLFWAVKSMLLAKCAASAAQSGLKPFVYAKAKRSSENYREAELKKMSSELVHLYHDARLGKRDLETGLERWVLGI